MPPLSFLRRTTIAVAIITALTVVGCAAPSQTARPAAPPTAALTPTSVTVPSEIDWAPLDKPRQLSVPGGWTISAWARPNKARLLAFAPDGRLLVSRPADGRITLLTPNKRGRPTSRTLVKDLRQPHGMAFDGSTLYVAESHRVSAYKYSDGTVSSRRTVLGGLPDAKSPELGGAYSHALKTVAVGADKALYVSIGSQGNISAGDRSASPQRASVLRVPPGGGKPTVFARGVRNGTGLAVAPDGAVWTAVNNRDNILYPYQRDYTGDGSNDYKKRITGYVNDHPLEPLAKLTAGRDLGWPYCNPDPDLNPGAPDTRFAYANRGFVRDVETNESGSKLDCATLRPVEQGLGAHSAPLGLSFTTAGLPSYGDGALVGVHGSWNRNPPRSPEVAFFASSNGGLGNQQTLITGFQSASGSRWGRPVAAVQGPDGALYVSDDLANAVYRVAPTN